MSFVVHVAAAISRYYGLVLLRSLTDIVLGCRGVYLGVLGQDVSHKRNDKIRRRYEILLHTQMMTTTQQDFSPDFVTRTPG